MRRFVCLLLDESLHTKQRETHHLSLLHRPVHQDGILQCLGLFRSLIRRVFLRYEKGL